MQVSKINSDKNSNSPNSPPKKGNRTTFQRMKDRLQYKSGVLDDDRDVENGGPIPFQSIPPLVVPPPVKDSPRDEADLDDMDVEEEVDKKDKSNFFNRSSPMKVVRVCKKMNTDQHNLIVAAEFTGMLGMKCSKLIPELCHYLMDCFDPVNCVLDFGERGKIPVDVDSVGRVMAVPNGKYPMPYNSDIDATGLIFDMLGINDGKQPTIASIETQLGPTYLADADYVRKFVMFIVSALFAPTTSITVSPKCYPALLNAGGISRLNWAQFIIDTLVNTAKAKEKKNRFKACMPYLMVLYVDSLETDAVQVSLDGPRICAWTNKMIRMVTDLDIKPDGSFGNLQLKACFRKKTSLFSSDPDVVDMFISSLVPFKLDEEHLSECRSAVMDMCNAFDDGLAKFIKNLANSQLKRGTRSEKQGKVQEKNIPKRKRAVNAPKSYYEGEHQEDESDHMQDVIEVKPKKRKYARKAVSEATDTKKISKGKESLPSDIVVGMEDVSKEATQDLSNGVAAEDTVTMKIPSPQVAIKETLTPSPITVEVVQSDCVEDVQMDSSQVARMMLTRTKKAVSFAEIDTTKSEVKISQECSPSGRRAVTRSMSPVIASSSPPDSSVDRVSAVIRSMSPSISPSNKDVTCSPKRSPRLAAADSIPRQTEETLTEVHSQATAVEQQTPTVTEMGNVTASLGKLTRFATPVASANANGGPVVTRQASANANVGISIDLNRKLESASAECQNEVVHQRKMRELVDDCPSFSLGLTQDFEKERDESATVDEVVVISSYDDSGDSLDKIYASIDLPITTPSTTKGNDLLKQADSPTNPNSHTPVPYARRIVKAGPKQKSPYGNQDKKPSVPRSDSELYNKVCSFGGRSKDPLNDEKIIDYGDFYVYLRDVANSIKPEKWLSNSVCEIALRVLSPEMAKERKFVMPLNIATKLRDPTCHLDRTVNKAFECTSTYRLDHKDLIMFSVLQNLTPASKDIIGHYYLITLNLKAGRFELMDSMRKEGNRGLMADAKKIIGSIKHLREKHYSESKINISKYKTVHIPTPMQGTTYDCGYFLLKFIESWNGRRMLQFNPSDMPAFRKLYLKKWMDRDDNLANWEQLLF